MRNPLRRAYNQLSRLIINEGFKDFAKLYGFDPKDPDYQDVKDAYNDIKTNKELKDFYKAKMVKDGINISNLDRAFYEAYSSDETVSPVEKFLEDYKRFSVSYKDENRVATLRREREKLKAKCAGNVVQETSDFIVYEVKTFEEAKQMRWLWMGDVPQYANPIPREHFDHNAPDDSQPYQGDKSPKEMAEYMMSNNEFIMNPSWCVCAGKNFWDSYNCDEVNENGSASCHLIFSKKYPNCRFCVVKNSSKYEIRDPWQAGRFGGKNQVRYGYEVLWAVFGNAVNLIKCLRDDNASYDDKMIARSEQFILAVKEKDVEKARRLIEHGIAINYYDKNGVSPFWYASSYGQKELCVMLLERGANVDKTGYGKAPIIRAVEEGNVEIFKLMLHYGANVKVQDEEGWSLLHEAAANGYMEISEILLERGVDVHVKDNDGLTPLHEAAGEGKTEMCKLLLDNGAEVNAKSKIGDSPLYFAAEYGHLETCKLLLSHKANVKSKNMWDSTPLHVAAYGGFTEVCVLLLNNGADVNAKDDNDMTPLSDAEYNGFTDTCQKLKEYGAVE